MSKVLPKETINGAKGQSRANNFTATLPELVVRSSILNGLFHARVLFDRADVIEEFCTQYRGTFICTLLVCSLRRALQGFKGLFMIAIAVDVHV